MTVNERIKLLRTALGLTQRRFAEPLHMTQNTISSIENGSRNANERLLDNICRNYGANPAWMRTGEGPMLADFTAGLDVDADVKQLGMQYVKLTEQQRKVVRDMVDALLGGGGEPPVK